MPVRPCRIPRCCGLERPASGSEARAWQLKAADFAEDLVRPLGLALDRLPSAHAVGSGSPLHDFIAQAHCEHCTRLTDPAALGGVGLSRGVEYAVLEELAAADAGLAALLMAAPFPFRVAHAAGGSLDGRLGRPYLSGSTAGLSGCTLAAPGRHGPRVRPDGRGWRLSGAASGPVVGAATATHAAIMCVAPAGSAMAVVPLERAGIDRKAPAERPGLRASAAARIELTDVRLRGDELIPASGRDASALVPSVQQLASAIVCVGIARAAYEVAARWVTDRETRMSGPLALMSTTLERTRSLTRSAHCFTYRRLDAGQPVLPQRATLACRLASQTAAELVRQALWIVGPSALDPDGVEHLDGSRSWPEKLLRDACEFSLVRPGAVSAAPARSVNPSMQRSATWGL
jgi:alkylation response protein AidB-like acyl-CoA dehydrogenase